MYDSKKYWLVGHTFGKQGSQLERFIKNRIWETKHVDGIISDQKLKEAVQEIKIGDILILKSTATKGPNHSISFLRVKGIGIVIESAKSYRVDNSEYYQYQVDWINVKDTDFDGSTYGSYRKMIHLLNNKLASIREYVDKYLKELYDSQCNPLP